MSLGSSYTVFEVLQARGTDPDTVVSGLTHGRVFPIDTDAGRTSTAGFAVFEDPLSTEFDQLNTYLAPLAAWAYRTDTIRVPTSTQKLAVRQRVKENLAATRREKMPRKERDELAEQVHADLLSRTPATIKAVDVAWDFASQRLRISTRSPSLVEDFATRVREHLGMELRQTNIVGIVEGCLGEQDMDLAYRLYPRMDLTGILPAGTFAAAIEKADIPIHKRLSMVDKLRRTHFLGREFLTWLMARSHLDEGIFRDPDGKVLEVFFERAVVLEGDDAARDKSALTVADPTESDEVMVALRASKKVSRARLLILLGGREFGVVLDSTLGFRGVKLPDIETPDFAEALAEQHGLASDLEDAVRDLFVQFLRRRLIQKDWDQEVGEIAAWIQGSAAEAA